MADQPILLLDVNGAQAWQEGDRILVGFARSGWAPTTRFVAALVTFICAMNGVAMLALGEWLAGVIVAVVATVAGAITVFAHKRIGARDPAPPEKLELILDKGARLLLDGDGTVLSPLDAAHCKRAFQIGSSSQKLVVRWPNGSRTVARGNPFGDPVDDMLELLVRHGVVRG